MGVTKINEVKAPQSRAYLGATLPTSPYVYYGSASNDVDSVEWRGGEMAFNTTDNKFYVQTATSGTTAIWKRYPTAATAA